MKRLRIADCGLRIVAALVACAPAAAARAIEVTLQRLDGTSVTGDWASCDGRSVLLRAPDGERAFAIDDLDEMTFQRGAGAEADASAAPLPAGWALIHAADGARFPARIIRGFDSGLVVETGFASELQVPFERLAAVQYIMGDAGSKPADLFASALAARRPGEDVLITRDEQGARSVRGTINTLDAERGEFRVADKARTFDVGKAQGIVFATGAQGPVASQALVSLHGDATLGGRLVGGDAVGLRLETSFGAAVVLPIRDISRLRFHNERVVFVSELTALDEKVEGRLHRFWPVVKDAGFAGHPLSTGGRAFARGLGVHSRSELTYDLNGEFETFAATIGLDDRVRPRGSVVFRMLGDDKVLADTGLVTGGDPPRDLVVAIKGVKRLTLLVDYGDGLDVGDQAVWGQARVIRPSR